jgi:signal transduction histidine kinase
VVSQVPRPRIAVVGSVAVIAVSGTVAVLTSQSADWTPISLVVVLAGFQVCSELLAIRSARPGAAPWATNSSAPLVLLMVLAGPAPAAAVGALGLFVDDVRVRPGWLARFTNHANFLAFTVSGGLLARWIGGALGIDPSDPGFALLVLGTYAYTNVGSFSLNLLSGWLCWGDSIRGQFERERMWAGADIVASPLAVATAYAYMSYGLLALGLLVVPQLIYQYLARNLAVSRDRADALQLRADELSRLNATLAELSESRGRLVGQVLQAEENERRRLADSLHHEALQDLVFAQGLVASQNGKSEPLGAAIGRAVEQIRATIFDLHPAVLKHAGLKAALQEVCDQQSERAGFKARLAVDAKACGQNDQLLFILAREQLTNVAKHAKANVVELSIQRQNGSLVMNVSDDGCGMDAERRGEAIDHGHIGLASAAERVEALGGKLEIESEPGEGTWVRTVVPANTSDNELRGPPESMS